MLRDDTIAAIATPSGSGGIGVIRMSGPKAKSRLESFFKPLSPRFVDFCPWKLHRGNFYNSCGELLDDVLAVYMPGPNTFTGEDVVELHCHGNYMLLTTILEELLTDGARLADRGEFSYRAFLNGRIDLTQAEAIAELVSAASMEEVKLASARLKGLMGDQVKDLYERVLKIRTLLCLAIDFSEEDIEDIITEEKFIAELESIRLVVQSLVGSFERSRHDRGGLVVALAGLVNVGKSSLFNALLARERAIVTDCPGTTRDFLEETIYVSGLPARVIDTAGCRLTSDPIESQGILAGRAEIHKADIVLLVIDSLQGLTEETLELVNDLSSKPIIYVWNKVDLTSPGFQEDESGRVDALASRRDVYVSAKTGFGIDELTRRIYESFHALCQNAEPKPNEVAPNIRQARILAEVLEEIDSLISDVKTGTPYDLCAVRVESVATSLGSIIGFVDSEDLLNNIFASFCIGK